MRLAVLAAVSVALLIAATPSLAKSAPKQTERALYCGYSFLLEAADLRAAGKNAAARKVKEEGELDIKFAVARLHWEDFSEAEISKLKQKFETQVAKDRAKGKLKFQGAQCTPDAVMNA